MDSSLPNGEHCLNGRKASHPRKLPHSILVEICNALSSSSVPLSELCAQHPHWPAYQTIQDQPWKNPRYKAMFLHARERQADFLAQQTLAETERIMRDPEPTMPRVQAVKVHCENVRWYAGKVLRRMYGDDPAVSVTNQQAVVVSPEQLNDLRGRLEEARALYGKAQASSGATKELK